MKSNLTLILLLLLSTSLFAQDIQEIQAYNKLGGTRIIALKTDKSGKWFTKKSGWKNLPSGEIPKGDVRFMDVYHKLAGLKLETRLVVVLADNSIWWTQKNIWKKVPAKGLPAKLEVKGIEPYVKAGLYGVSKTFIVAILSDDSMWRYDKKKGWQVLPTKGLPSGVGINTVQHYQHLKAMSSVEIRLAVKLDDNSIWWFREKKKSWVRFENKSLPTSSEIILFETYMKYKAMSSPEGRFLAVLSDHTLWWASVKSEQWKQVDTKGLPEGREFKSIKGYPKNSDGSNGSRLIALLKDNTIWWYSAKSGWSEVPNKGL